MPFVAPHPLRHDELVVLLGPEQSGVGLPRNAGLVRAECGGDFGGVKGVRLLAAGFNDLIEPTERPCRAGILRLGGEPEPQDCGLTALNVEPVKLGGLCPGLGVARARFALNHGPVEGVLGEGMPVWTAIHRLGVGLVLREEVGHFVFRAPEEAA
jgi:hypothetical protein